MIVSRQEIAQRVSDTTLKSEINRFDDKWVRFTSAFEEKLPSCREFVVVIAEVLNGKVIPVGMEIVEIDGDEIIGYRFENELIKKNAQLLKVSTSQVIDARYSWSYLLEEGGLYRLFEARLTGPARRMISEFTNFFVDLPVECKTQDIELLRRVEDARTTQELLEICLESDCDPVEVRKLPGRKRMKEISSLSVLEYLATHAYEEKVIALLESHAVDQPSLAELFRIAIEQKCNSVFSYLLKLNRELHRAEWGSENSLHVAVKNDNVEAAQRLVDLGLDIDESNVLDETPFALARSKEMAAMLKSKGADVFRKIADDGTTAAEYLYIESYSKCPELATYVERFCSKSFLEEFHADSDIPDGASNPESEADFVPVNGSTITFLLEAADTDFGSVLPVRELPTASN